MVCLAVEGGKVNISGESPPRAGGGGDPLGIESEERAEGLVVHVSGEVDLANVTYFKDALQPALRNCRNVIINVSNLRYIDSSGLHVLIDTNQVLRQNNCQLVVVGASPSMAKVMQILHLDELIPLVSMIDEATALLRAKSSAAASDG
jgi:anti-anti-sigma factor